MIVGKQGNDIKRADLLEQVSAMPFSKTFLSSKRDGDSSLVPGKFLKVGEVVEVSPKKIGGTLRNRKLYRFHNLGY